MNRSLVILAALALVSVAGCASPPADEDSSVGASDDALSSIVDEPAVATSDDGAKPKVQTVDLSTIDFDLASLKDARGKIDFTKLDVDVLDTGNRFDHDYSHRSSNMDLKWVESDKRQLPEFVDKLAHGFDVGGGKCRISSLSLKKVVVGCKWTF